MQETIQILKKPPIQSILIKWTISWLAVAGGTIYILPSFGADQLNRFYVTSLYFFLFAVAGSYYFRIFEVFSHHANFKKQFFSIIILMILFFIICIAFDFLMPLKSETYSNILNSNFYFPLFKFETLISKFCDIAFQQVFIFGLVKTLKNQALSEKNITKIFTLIFFALHLPLIFSLKWYAFLFIIPSTVAGSIFSFLILNFRWGLVKSFALHLTFYLIIGIFLRLF